ncbi:MAG: D-alanyl-D-alanine carboxypeptidase [Rhodospirillaceae bacterium]|nr:D-alanyl-D-alanine carboxypeptidase [Rhodospirillaceae bacterium]
MDGSATVLIKLHPKKTIGRALARTSNAVALLFMAVFFVFSIGSGDAHAKYASLIIDANSGEVLHSVNSDTRNYPASLTKMMTLYLMFESIDEGRLRFDDKIVFSRRAARQPSSKMGIAAGKSISVKDAILSIAIKSANDVATAVAEHMGGTERKFALMMTAKARALGMKNTTFRNASGLPHRAQLSTARDLSKLAIALYRDYPQYYGVFSQAKFVLNGKSHKTHNTLLTSYEGTDGIKTGYIRASGFNLVTSVNRGDRRLVGVVLGGNSAKERNKHMTTLLNKSFAKLDQRVAANNAENIKPINPKTQSVGAQKNDWAAKTTVTPRNGQTVWGVQVGVYKQRQPAVDIAAKAIGLAPSYLAKGEIVISPLYKKNGNLLYRARVVGVEKRSAYRACNFLEKKKMDCLEVKVELPLEVAAIGTN